jgi:predicted 3-demethylubiquinone-9 3-methyltransferase (glyoxalase superfamily)
MRVAAIAFGRCSHMQKIRPCLWFEKNQGEEAAQFYCSLFPRSTMGAIQRYTEETAAPSGSKVGSVMTVMFELEGIEFLALNGGPGVWSLTPATSFFVWCDSEAEIDRLYSAFTTEGGMALMELQEYPFAKKYAWVNDRFGVSWQLILVPPPNAQRIAPAFLFVGDKFGKAEEAMARWTSLFKNSHVVSVNKYPAGGPDEGAVAHAIFNLEGMDFVASESSGPHEFTFTGATSFMIFCESQEEVDHFWSRLTADGGAPSQCGWLTDKYGVTWQVVPTVLDTMMRGVEDEARAKRMMGALMTMTKPDIASLQAAAR